MQVPRPEIKLSVENFRNLHITGLAFSGGINILHGDNAQGKTNIIEAIYLCATGRSPRVAADGEMIRHDQPEAHVRLETDRHTVDVHLVRRGTGKTARKGIALNHTPVSNRGALAGTLPVVLFTPEELRIVKAGPYERRTFLDTELCQLSPAYYDALRRYHHALKQRNALLKSDAPNLLDTLPVWDAVLCRYGPWLMRRRADFVERLNVFAAEIHARITGRAEIFQTTYRPNATDADAYAERLARSLDRDRYTGSTQVGIHKDDLLLTVDGNDVRTYGSQGQQRTVALALKLAEIDLIAQALHRKPLLLLDDVLSELDESRAGHLFRYMEGTATILTCTGAEGIMGKASGKSFRVKGGRLEETVQCTQRKKHIYETRHP